MLATKPEPFRGGAAPNNHYLRMALANWTLKNFNAGVVKWARVCVLLLLVWKLEYPETR
jgi:hypothetical protein